MAGMPETNKTIRRAVAGTRADSDGSHFMTYNPRLTSYDYCLSSAHLLHQQPIRTYIESH